eukprot:SAG11_NODE_856_length_6864_cov_12.741168_9_plen_56_part_00
MKAVDDKYADVCIGLNNKLGSTQVQLDTRIDKVVDDVNKSLQVQCPPENLLRRRI